MERKKFQNIGNMKIIQKKYMKVKKKVKNFRMAKMKKQKPCYKHKQE